MEGDRLPKMLADPLGSALARSAFEAAREGLLVLAPDGTVTAANRAFCEMLGVELATVLAQPWNKELEIVQRALKGEVVSDLRQAMRNQETGEEFAAHCWATPVSGKAGLSATILSMVDVTREARTRMHLETALSSAGIGTYRADLVEGKIFGDKNFAKIYGFSEERVNGGPVDDLFAAVHPDDLERVRAEVEIATSAGKAYEVEYRIFHPDGTMHWIMTRGRAEFDPIGKPLRRQGSALDITERKLMEEALRRQTQRYEAVLGAERKITEAGGEHELLLRAAMDEAIRLTGADGASLEVRDGNDMVYEAAGGSAARFVGFRLPVATSLSGKTLLWGTITKCDDAETDDRVDKEACRKIGVRSMVLVPLRYDQHAFGVLKILSQHVNAFTSGDTQALELLAGFLGAAIGRAKANKALRESATQYRQIAEAIPQIVWTMGGDGGAEFFNDRWYEYTGINAETGQDWDWSDFLHPDDREATVALWNRCLETGEPYRIEIRLQREDETYRWFLAEALPIRREDGEILRWFGTLTDVHDQKAAEEELERKVSKRTEQLKSANEALESFTHHVAHDLRAPLRSIVSACHFAAEDFGDKMPPEALATMKKQANAAKRMALLIDDLLAMARLSRTEAKRVATDITELAQEAAEEAKAAHPDSTVKVEVEEGLHADADPRLLKLAIANLVENGVKYSPDGGTVRVFCQDGAFCVSDEGIGIAPAYFEKVFEPFQRLNREERFKGTGIGLSNVRQIVALHGGRVWVESEPGKGSRFLFTLG